MMGALQVQSNGDGGGAGEGLVGDDPGYVEVDPTGRYGRYNEVLGKGSSKIVYRAFDEHLGMEVAWNKVQVRDFLRSHGELERLYGEIHLLRSLRHAVVMRLHASWVDAPRRAVNFVTELLTSGTLRQYRRRHPPTSTRRHPPGPQVRQHLRQRQSGPRQDRGPWPRRRPPPRRRRPLRGRRHAGVHGARGLRRGLRRARRRLLLRHVRPRDGHPRVPLQRVRPPHPNLQESHLRDKAGGVVQGEGPGGAAVHREMLGAGVAAADGGGAPQRRFPPG